MTYKQKRSYYYYILTQRVLNAANLNSERYQLQQVAHQYTSQQPIRKQAANLYKLLLANQISLTPFVPTKLFTNIHRHVKQTIINNNYFFSQGKKSDYDIKHEHMLLVLILQEKTSLEKRGFSVC
eukprot:TRINITY_DN3683_c0_g2_i3.p8 TRINITY_DN3683_c0_g2~~TRINITY_DN3683_c0_g2_i3.p8  ORF type:complete len:125 (+),score=0.40 TRINITY_DN3683_c0_g2_i3:1073-1447(+)